MNVSNGSVRWDTLSIKNILPFLFLSVALFFIHSSLYFFWTNVLDRFPWIYYLFLSNRLLCCCNVSYHLSFYFYTSAYIHTECMYISTENINSLIFPFYKNISLYLLSTAANNRPTFLSIFTTQPTSHDLTASKNKAGQMHTCTFLSPMFLLSSFIKTDSFSPEAYINMYSYTIDI